MKIILFEAFRDPYRESMAVYARELYGELVRAAEGKDEVTSYLPQRVWLEPKWLRYWSQYVHYQAEAGRQRADVYHIIDHSFSHLTRSLDPAKTVITVHDVIGFTNGRPARSLDMKGWMIARNLRALEKCARVICDSEATRKALLELTPVRRENTDVIPLGVDELFYGEPRGNPRQSLGIGPGPCMLHIGHNRFYKNIPALFHVLSRLKDFKLIKVGEDFTEEQLALANKLGVTQRIQHVGQVQRALLPILYRAADVLLFPSLNEGFGFPVLEAMASGLPVVASNRGSLPEVAGEAALLADPEDHDTLAKLVRAAANDKRDDLIRRGRERARAFTWQKTARRTMEIYREITEKVHA